MDQRVDTDRLQQAGTAIGSVAPGLSDAKDRVIGIEVRPGAFADADTLKGKVKTCVDAYVQVTHDIRGLSEDLDRKLKQIATDYQDTERTNNDVADGIPDLAGKYHITVQSTLLPTAPPTVPGDQLG